MAKSDQPIIENDFQPGIGVLQVTGYKNGSLKSTTGGGHYVLTSDGVPIGEIFGEKIMVSAFNAVEYLSENSIDAMGLGNIPALKQAYSQRKKSLGSNIDEQTKKELNEMKKPLDALVQIDTARERAAAMRLYMILNHPKKEPIIKSRELYNRAKNYHLSPLRD